MATVDGKTTVAKTEVEPVTVEKDAAPLPGTEGAGEAKRLPAGFNVSEFQYKTSSLGGGHRTYRGLNVQRVKDAWQVTRDKGGNPVIPGAEFKTEEEALVAAYRIGEPCWILTLSTSVVTKWNLSKETISQILRDPYNLQIAEPLAK